MARVEYLEAYDSYVCELCERAVICRYCHNGPRKGEKYVMCNLDGIHSHKACLKPA